jgi:tRNA 2-thiouridine synthesizing protein A
VGKEAEVNKVIDLRGVSCPWSILKAKSQLTTMEPGEVLEVLSGDPMLIKDFPKVLGERGHQLIKIKDKHEFSRLYVRRGKSKQGK